MSQAADGSADGTEAPLLPSSAAGTPPPPTADLTLMSGAELFMREDVGLTDAEVEVLSGSMNVFMLASILAAGSVADHLGRRCTLVLANARLSSWPARQI
ncbi:unnamed protein product [Miscanthus lutarioriparius]|uniref:Major facilitator superfamily (MFS) profile domain-containing protein n=1 Tax=Miscanthus lutarioriparius TaxID=422564 RepID=A0A811QIS8_9POAL|nr:unnamed protein product [Miscanthus lutarioriparius]